MLSVLVGGERDDRRARAGEIGRKGEVAQDGCDVEGHMGAVQNDRNPPGPKTDIEALHAAGEARGGAGLGADQPGADRGAAKRRRARAHFAEPVERRACERDIGVLDRRRGARSVRVTGAPSSSARA